MPATPLASPDRVDKGTRLIYAAPMPAPIVDRMASTGPGTSGSKGSLEKRAEEER